MSTAAGGRSRYAYFPWITLYLALLIGGTTIAYSSLPAPFRANPAVIWISSPFNVFYEAANHYGIIYNFVLVVLFCFFVESYSRAVADLKGRVSLIRNAFLLSIVASYIVSLVWWKFLAGFPSSGTSIIGFSLIVFFAFEVYDSEIIKRLPGKKGIRWDVEIIGVAFALLVLAVLASTIYYLNGSSDWYIHLFGGVIFVFLYYIYMSWHRSTVDRIEERIEYDIESDLKTAGKDIESGLKIAGKDIEQELKDV